ncbi:GNAT family N-acetyltransferase [Paenibacillus sp. AN1007]|uniref:GNAT family N-acetyltransferase n=1 Tax=Paenibacillus sp. AN1007 TaxID=3151385 RepID=A0AAU8NMS6_9BACL
MLIREAVMNDAEGIAKVHVDSWRTTYHEIIPEKFLNSLSYEQRTELWIENIGKTDDFVILAENTEGKIVGFADCWKRETNTVTDAVDLTSIYILKAYQGIGLGKQLLKHIFHHSNALGYQRIFVNVLEDNKTRYFYEHYGAHLYESVQVKIGGKVLNELVYEWDNLEEVLARLTKTN